MDAVTVGAVLGAVAGGAGGAAGKQVWDGAVALVRRPFRHGQVGGGAAAVVSSGAAELVALQQAPGDQQRATALAAALVARAAADQEFAQALQGWWDQARHLQVSRDVTNTISGGTQHGPVLQGRDFTGLTFTTPAAPPPADPPAEGHRM